MNGRAVRYKTGTGLHTRNSPHPSVHAGLTCRATCKANNQPLTLLFMHKFIQLRVTVRSQMSSDCGRKLDSTERTHTGRFPTEASCSPAGRSWYYPETRCSPVWLPTRHHVDIRHTHPDVSRSLFMFGSGFNDFVGVVFKRFLNPSKIVHML